MSYKAAEHAKALSALSGPSFKDANTAYWTRIDPSMIPEVVELLQSSQTGSSGVHNPTPTSYIAVNTPRTNVRDTTVSGVNTVEVIECEKIDVESDDDSDKECE
jgi:hypothetical protein